MMLDDGRVPLVGVESTIDAIARTLSNPNVNGAFVVGEAGTGKSAIARRLVSIIDPQHTKVFMVRASASLADVPYGSLGPYLTHATPQTLKSSLPALRALVAFFRQASEGREAVVVIDDAHYLDEDSSHVLTQLVISRIIKVVLFSNGMPPRSGDLFSLYTDGFISRVDLEGLNDAEVETLCESILGGRLAQGAKHYLARQSAGNPLMLRALLDHATATAELVDRDGVFCLSGRFHRPVPQLMDLAKTLLQGLTEQERTIYEVVALSGGITQAKLAGIEEDAVTQQLLRRGLLRTLGSSTSPVRVTHPILARVIRALVPAGRSAELRHLLFGDEVVLPALHEGMVQYLDWALDCGVMVPSAVLLGAARTAAHVSEPESALRFASAARAGGEDDAGAVEEARVRVNLGEYAVAVDLLDQVLSGAVRPPTVADAATLKALASVQRGDDPGGIHGIADACMEQLASAGTGSDDAGPSTPAAGPAPYALRLLHVLGSVLEGEFPVARTAVDAVDAELPAAVSEADARLPVFLLLLRGEIDAGLGHSDAALAEIRTALDTVNRSHGDLEYLRPHVVARYVNALIHTGEFAVAIDALEEYRRRPVVSLDYLSGPLAALEAVLEVRRGRFQTALHILQPALASLRQVDSEMLLPYALGVAAWAAHSLGDYPAKRAYKQEFDGVASIGSRPLLLLGRAFLAAACTGGADGNFSGLEGVAVTAQSAPYPSCEKDTLELLLVLGDTARAWRLAELADQFEGAEAQVLSRYAHAVVDDDANSLLLVADQAERMQKVPLAAAASARAMRLFDQQGDSRLRRLALRAVRHRQSLLEGLPPQEEGDLRSAHELTSREREIARLAAAGATNRAIARALVLSTRTVEGHLYRIYGKLGITARDELAGEMEAYDDDR
ncbi:DNA-binding CsgD family transcriptional regulator [Arthrobacter sp. PL16]|uniref:helix-turn-helix transcriptional regulator n=1 Tax=Arthrobacter sp. PL16 TaxID=3071720 RepID=UPI002DFA800D|nr:DNA-binding CsgD family transcriptional regulator [Arthrobacter sp. PL16]